jgi:hypothetical protein
MAAEKSVFYATEIARASHNETIAITVSFHPPLSPPVRSGQMQIDHGDHLPAHAAIGWDKF